MGPNVSYLWEESDMPSEFWREPNTGIIMLKPGVFRESWIEDEDWADFRIAMTDLVSGGLIDAPSYAAGGSWSLITPKRDSASVLIDVLAAAAAVAVARDALGDDTLRTVGRLDGNLGVNEGWSAFIDPAGKVSSRALNLMAFCFGGDKFYLAIRTNGEFSLLYNFGDAIDTDWRMILQSSFKEGGVDHRLPFQVTVIPFGKDYVSILFSNFGGGRLQKLRYPSVGYQPSAHLIELSKFGIECPWNSDLQNYQKTEAGTLHIEMPLNRWSSSFSLARVAYPSGEHSLNISPFGFALLKPDQPPGLTVFGLGDDGSFPLTAPQLSQDVLGPTGASWDPETDTQGSIEITMESSPNRSYTPEFWSYDLTFQPVITTPEWTPVDVSSKFTHLRLKLTAASESPQATLKLQGGDFAKILHRPGPLMIEVQSAGGGAWNTVLNGYGVTRELDPHGVISARSVGRLREELVVHGRLWDQLNSLSLAEFPAIDARTFTWIFENLFGLCGYDAGDIDIDSDFDDLRVSDTQSPQELKVLSGDTKGGDLIRDLQTSFDRQQSDSFRVREVGDQARAYWADAWDIADEWPDHVFLMHHDLMGEWDTAMSTGFGPGERSDVDRWNVDQDPDRERFYIMNSGLEITVDIPEFNALTIVAQTKGAESPDATLVSIPASPDVLDDTSPAFEGRVRTEIKAPPEALAEDLGFVKAWARSLYDLEQRKGYQASFEGEWQPEIEPDQFIMILGRTPDGTAVSFGVWRIQEIDVEIALDWSSDSVPDISWSWRANYTVVYQGESDHPDFPMVTTEGGEG